MTASECASATSAPSSSRRRASAAGAPAAVRSATRRRSASIPPPNDEPLPIDTRSLASVVRASGQPPSTSPITQSSGTNTSSRNTSLNMARPVISRSGRMSMPGVAMSTMK
jgi:hypothetical protein